MKDPIDDLDICFVEVSKLGLPIVFYGERLTLNDTDKYPPRFSWSASQSRDVLGTQG